MPPPPSLDALLSKVREEAIRFRKAQQESGQAEMTIERAELQARVALTPHSEAIKMEIGRLKSVHLLEGAIAKCLTNRITLEGGKASKAVITDCLRSSFETNLSDVGFSGTLVEVQIGSGEYGEHPHEMRLKPRPDIRPRDVLSEGERTCVALAGFLAELETTGNKSVIVLDDPVSSLDQQYRKQVAERLVIEAETRQVILLTHDVVFLFLLKKYSGDRKVPMAELTLERGYEGNHGKALKGPPWIAMTVKERISKLRNQLAAARRPLKEGNREEYRRTGFWIYEELRKAWEQAVEEVLLNKVVMRFGDSVETNRLEKLTDITVEDITMVTSEMTKCPGFVHHEAAVNSTDIPEPDVVEKDIKRLADWVKKLRTTRDRG